MISSFIGLFIIASSLPLQFIKSLFYPLFDPVVKVVLFVIGASLSLDLAEENDKLKWTGYLVGSVTLLYAALLISVYLKLYSAEFKDSEEEKLYKTMEEAPKPTENYSRPDFPTQQAEPTQDSTITTETFEPTPQSAPTESGQSSFAPLTSASDDQSI